MNDYILYHPQGRICQKETLIILGSKHLLTIFAQVLDGDSVIRSGRIAAGRDSLVPRLVIWPRGRPGTAIDHVVRGHLGEAWKYDTIAAGETGPRGYRFGCSDTKSTVCTGEILAGFQKMIKNCIVMRKIILFQGLQSFCGSTYFWLLICDFQRIDESRSRVHSGLRWEIFLRQDRQASAHRYSFLHSLFLPGVIARPWTKYHHHHYHYNYHIYLATNFMIINGKNLSGLPSCHEIRF